MISPPYPIPSSRRLANSELTNYVRREFNDNESHWFTLGAKSRESKKTKTETRNSTFRGFFRTRRREAPEVRATFVPCAVLLEQRCEETNSATKRRT